MRSVSKTGQVRIVQKALGDLRPSPENDRLYRPVNADDPEILALAESVRREGLLVPLVITLDNYILSGHRRHVAAGLAGLRAVPCRVEPITRSHPDFLTLLRKHNRQRVKTLAETAREEFLDASVDGEEAYRHLIEGRSPLPPVEPDLERIVLRQSKKRARITAAKWPMLEAAIQVLRDRREFLPLTLRQIHYALLNNPPLRHARKPGSAYANDRQSYKDLSDLLLRARIVEEIPWDWIEDGTRPVVTWECHEGIGGFIREQMEGLLKGYFRDLQQSQDSQLEIIGEKNTIEGVIRPIASEFCVPYTLGRGYASGPPRQAMRHRFRRSGKRRLVLLVMSDWDPEGEDIGRAFAQSMRDDLSVEDIVPVKVGLTHRQVRGWRLPPRMKAKEGSSRRKKFVERHGEDVFELEAIPPRQLQAVLREAILGSMDVGRYNAEVEREKEDARYLEGLRRGVLQHLEGIAGLLDEGGQ